MLKYLYLFFLMAVPLCGVSQQDSLTVKLDDQEISPIQITENDVAPFRNDEKFNYETERPDDSWWDNVKNWLYNLLRRFFEWLFGIDAAPNYIAAFLKYVPYLLLALLLFLLIRFFIKVNTKNILFGKANENTVILSEEERIIKTADIQSLIQKALEQKNYRLAIRYHYLLLLKLLTERELIAWELQKTNDDYLHELAQSQLRPLFQKVTLLYDYIWYGEFQIDGEGYERAKNPFDQLKKSITAHV